MIRTWRPNLRAKRTVDQVPERCRSVSCEGVAISGIPYNVAVAREESHG
jgi:hypothetical protein